MRQIFVVVSILASVILVLPALLVMVFSDSEANMKTVDVEETEDIQTVEEAEETDEVEEAVDVFVPVYRDQTEQVEEVELETYVRGVVASEMPASFEMEALKAQALVARTYVVKQMEYEESINLPGGALVTDTTSHQVYSSDEELQQRWGADYEEQMTRIEEAVNATAGEVITHDGDPITASFFSTSNGYTENVEDYWKTSLPYLRSVESPWDQEVSPRFNNTVTLTVGDVEAALGVSLPEAGDFAPITERTEGGRVAKVSIGEQTFHGREIREALGLDSSDFDWRREGNEVIVQTRGWGHGVGMSQYGADGMAKDGRNYEEIVTHYYQDIQIDDTTQAAESYVLNFTKEDETD